MNNEDYLKETEKNEQDQLLENLVINHIIILIIFIKIIISNIFRKNRYQIERKKN